MASREPYSGSGNIQIVILSDTLVSGLHVAFIMAGINVSDFLQSKARTADDVEVAQVWAMLDDLHSKK